MLKIKVDESGFKMEIENNFIGEMLENMLSDRDCNQDAKELRKQIEIVLQQDRVIRLLNDIYVASGYLGNIDKKTGVFKE